MGTNDAHVVEVALSRRMRVLHPERDQALGRETSNRMPVEDSDSGKCFRGIQLIVLWRSVDSIAMVIESNDVEIYFAPIGVLHHEVPVAVIVPFGVAEAERLQHTSRDGNVPFLDGNVEIAVVSCLATDQGIRRPATIDPDRRATRFEPPDQFSGRLN